MSIRSERFTHFTRFIAIFGKLPKLAVVLKLFKASKLLVMAGSMAVSVFAYGFASGSWPFGFGLVGLLLVHEMGHVWAARRQGVATSWPVFIPFIGAAIFIKKFSTLRAEAIVAVGGPLLGSAAALLLLVPYAISGERIWVGLAYLGLMLNAFNLIPLRPLDGGRMTSICGRWFRVGGFALLGALTIAVRQPVILYIWVLVLNDIAFPQWWRTGTSSALSVAMALLMLGGYSSQPWFVDGVDCCWVALMTFAYFTGEQCVAEGKPDPFEEHFDDALSVTTQERVTWGILWALMCVVLVGLMFVVQQSLAGGVG